MREAVQNGVVFFRTASDGILTKDEVDPRFIISIEDTVDKKMLFQRKEAVPATAKSSGDGATAGEKVGKAVQKIEGKDYVAPTFGPSPMKIKPPPPAYAAKAKQPEQPLGKPPGYAHQPKAEVPKAVESPKAKAPKSVPSPPVGPPPQKKAAVTGGGTTCKAFGAEAKDPSGKSCKSQGERDCSKAGASSTKGKGRKCCGSSSCEDRVFLMQAMLRSDFRWTG
eukprot:s8338_g1.t1